MSRRVNECLRTPARRAQATDTLQQADPHRELAVRGPPHTAARHGTGLRDWDVGDSVAVVGGAAGPRLGAGERGAGIGAREGGEQGEGDREREGEGGGVGRGGEEGLALSCPSPLSRCLCLCLCAPHALARLCRCGCASACARVIARMRVRSHACSRSCACVCVRVCVTDRGLVAG